MPSHARAALRLGSDLAQTNSASPFAPSHAKSVIAPLLNLSQVDFGTNLSFRLTPNRSLRLLTTKTQELCQFQAAFWQSSTLVLLSLFGKGVIKQGRS
ncbi:hypothetical protein ACQ4M3_40970 [Leptolyngbya sp. AN03gr2]|uniref:hypothetical protein n=1 Tax=unclassified Leptolyngbya TaxID=2650499 RepID=UPI003D323418